jgi:hypothetical protein
VFASHALAIGTKIVDGDASLRQSVELGEVPGYPPHVRRLRLLQGQPPIVAGICGIETVDEPLRTLRRTRRRLCRGRPSRQTSNERKQSGHGRTFPGVSAEKLPDLPNLRLSHQ